MSNRGETGSVERKEGAIRKLIVIIVALAAITGITITVVCLQENGQHASSFIHSVKAAFLSCWNIILTKI